MNIKKSIHNYDTFFDTEASLNELKKLREQLDFLIKKEESQQSKVETVASLRKKGWKVRVYHYREEKSHFFPSMAYLNGFYKERIVDPKGGRTEVSLITPDGRTSRGIAVCDKQDNYCRKEGVRIALERALKNLEKDALKDHVNKQIDLVKKYVEEVNKNKQKTPVNPWTPFPYPNNPWPHYPKPFTPWNDPYNPVWTTKVWCKL
jgi:hypothetical protein